MNINLRPYGMKNSPSTFSLAMLLALDTYLLFQAYKDQVIFESLAKKKKKKNQYPKTRSPLYQLSGGHSTL